MSGWLTLWCNLDARSCLTQGDVEFCASKSSGGLFSWLLSLPLSGAASKHKRLFSVSQSHISQAVHGLAHARALGVSSLEASTLWRALYVCKNKGTYEQSCQCATAEAPRSPKQAWRVNLSKKGLPHHSRFGFQLASKPRAPKTVQSAVAMNDRATDQLQAAD